MQILLLPFHRRFVIYTLSIVLTVLFAALAWTDPSLRLLSIPAVLFAGLAALGTMDLIQTRHAVLRNYPISAHLRFLLESIRPEMRQYFFEDEKDGRPFSRDQRALVSARQDAARQAPRSAPSTTSIPTATMAAPFARPRPHAPDQFRLTIGGPDCAKPYSASVFNISAMSFWRALAERDPRAQWRRQEKSFRARHRRGRLQPVPPRDGRRHHLGGRLRLFRLPQCGRPFNAGKFAETAVLDQIKMVG